MLPLAVNVFAEITLPPVILPPLPLVTILPAVMLPLAVNVLADMALILDNVPPDPEVTKLPTVALPVTFSVPAIFAPVPVTTNILALPARFIDFNEAKNCVDSFLNEQFEGGRHADRINKIDI